MGSRMTDPRRDNYTRRLHAIGERYNLPPLNAAHTAALVDQALKVRGDGLSDNTLRILHALTNRGFLI